MYLLRIMDEIQLKNKIIANIQAVGLNSHTMEMVLTYFSSLYQSRLLEEFADLLIEILEPDAELFCNQFYPQIRKELIKKYSEEEVCRIEKELVIQGFLAHEIDEHIISDFVGEVIIVGITYIRIILKGHGFITNYRMLCPFSKFKVKETSSASYPLLATSSGRWGALGEKIRDKISHPKLKNLYDILGEIIMQQQNETKKIPLPVLCNLPINNPYGIKKRSNSLEFWMNFRHRFVWQKLNFSISHARLRGESSKDYKKRKEEFFNSTMFFLKK